MNKPTLFFSHSSKDKELILLIKNKLDKATGGVLDVFMSSDGQSIPFGTNWIHKVEEGLQEAKIMFVFVTENSISSGWIYFEAGYAYSKGIQVIPVGMGIDISTLKAPLNLLQGFNVSSEDSLNNFVTIINRTFQYHFDGCFSRSDYSEIINALPNGVTHSLEFESIIRQAECTLYAEYSLPNGDTKTYDTDQYFKRIDSFLKNTNIQISKTNQERSMRDKILANGVKIEYYKRNGKGENGKRIDFSVSPYSFHKSFELLKNLFLQLEDQPFHYIRLHLRNPYNCITTFEDVSSIISNYPEFELDEEQIGKYICNDLGLNFCFFLEHNLERGRESETVMSIVFDWAKVCPEDILKLVSKLCDIKIIYKN